MIRLPALNRQGVYRLTVLLCAVLLVLLNITAGVLVRRFPFLTFDLTKSGVFRLDRETVKTIAALDKDLTIYVLAREEIFAETSVYNAQANEIIRQFEKNSPAISVEYIDYVRNPAFISQYPGLPAKHGDILVQRGDKYALVKTEDLFNYASGASGKLSIASSRAEEAVYTAVLGVSSDRTVRAALVSGHAEYTMTDFNLILEKNNYELETVNLLTGTISPGVDVVLIAEPKFDYGEEELEKLDAFLINGGEYGKTLVYCAGAEQPVLPFLAVFLREWGAAVDEGAVFETDEKRVYNYHPFFALADYRETSFADVSAENNRPVLMPVAKPLRAVFEFRNNYSVKTLLEFAASTGVRPPDAPEGFTADDAVRRGPLPALLLCAYSNRTAKASYLLVSGSTAMLDGFAVNNPSFGNSEYLIKLLNKLAGRETALRFRPKSLAGSGLNLSKHTVNILGAVLIFVIPLLVLVSGLVVWIRRIRS